MADVELAEDYEPEPPDEAYRSPSWADVEPPQCFASEYAFYEGLGSIPWGGTIYARDAREDIDYEPLDPRQPCQGPARTFEFLGLPERWHGHEAWCWIIPHDPAAEPCPSPF